MYPDLASLALFLKAVKLNSLTQAARQSHLSLSAASRRIALLEEHFGVQLLERTPQGVQATPAGQALAHLGGELLNQAATLNAEIADYAQGALGRVRLHANISAMSQRLPEQLAAFSAKHPRIKLEIHEARSSEIVEAVHEGHADIGVATITTPFEGMQYDLYDADPLCAIVPDDCPITEPAIYVEQLLPFDFVALDNKAATTRGLIRTAEAAQQPLKLRQQVHSFEAVCRLVAAGLGVAVLPLGTLHAALRTMSIRRIDLKDDWAQRDMYLCIKAANMSAPVRALYQFLQR